VLLQKRYGFKAHVFHAAGFNSKKEYEAKHGSDLFITVRIDHPHTLIYVVHQASSDRKLVCCVAHVMSHNELHRVQDIDEYDHICKSTEAIELCFEDPQGINATCMDNAHLLN
jgi:hypothetical protein